MRDQDWNDVEAELEKLFPGRTKQRVADRSDKHTVEAAIVNGSQSILKHIEQALQQDITSI
jgi:hypothetical protein